jgi:glycosyltransferase involved in cell wall biosynthesis
VSSEKKKRILFITPYPQAAAPSQRFRFEQYFHLLRTSGYQYDVQSFLDSQNWQIFFKTARVGEKALALVKGFIRRCALILKVKRYDFVFIHREASPVGPPVFEWLVAKAFRKKIIYDFDDAIWLTDRENESWQTKFLKWRSKTASICRWSFKVSCGNEYLYNYALRFNLNSHVNPTTIDTSTHHSTNNYRQPEQNEKVVIGWTGSHSTLKYLSEIQPALKNIIEKNKNVSFLIIADQAPALTIPFQFVKWNEEDEIRDLLKIDIGVMPLPDNDWTKGKCGFKALQYMALGIPAVVSPVGVNSKIIEHGKEGFLAATLLDWENYLLKLIDDKALREKMGAEGRKKVEGSYSVDSNAALFLSLFA